MTLLAKERRGFCKRGFRSVSLAQYCGVVNLGERVLEIVPKIEDRISLESGRGTLLRLLRTADQFPAFRHLSAGQQLRNAQLLEVFIAALFDTITQIVRGGLLRQYREHEQDLGVVRGRIVVGRQFSVLSNRSDVIACRFDDLTANNRWNQLLKAGLRIVRPWIRSLDLSRRWVELMMVFEEADDTHIRPRDLDRLVFDRQGSRYRATMSWVRWILELLSPELRAGVNTAPALLFDMNLLFQSAVANVLRRHPNRMLGVEIHTQEGGKYLATIAQAKDHKAVGLRPDLLIKNRNGVVAIADAKWKRVKLNFSGYLVPASSDIYQMHAYASAYQCEQLALVYPWHSGLQESRETTFELPPSGSLRPVVTMVCVDVTSDLFTLMRGRLFSTFLDVALPQEAVTSTPFWSPATT